MRRLGLLLLVTAAMTGCGDDDDRTATNPAAGTAEQTGPVQSDVRKVTVRETDFAIHPAKVQAGEEGLVRMTILNRGNVRHALAVDGPNGTVEFDGDISPGRSGTLEVDLDRAGSYTMYCPLGDHRARGMVGAISVSGTSPARGTQTQTTTTTETETTTTPTTTDEGSGGY